MLMYYRDNPAFLVIMDQKEIGEFMDCLVSQVCTDNAAICSASFLFYANQKILIFISQNALFVLFFIGPKGTFGDIGIKGELGDRGFPGEKGKLRAECLYTANAL